MGTKFRQAIEIIKISSIEDLEILSQNYSRLQKESDEKQKKAYRLLRNLIKKEIEKRNNE